jgi:hypothetical protein
MVVRRVNADERDVVFIRGILEASRGVAGMFSEGGGELFLVAPRSREAELDELLSDLFAELDLRAIP